MPFNVEQANQANSTGVRIGLAADIIITIWATLDGWLNANAWGSVVVLSLLLIGAIYQVSAGDRGNIKRGA